LAGVPVLAPPPEPLTDGAWWRLRWRGLLGPQRWRQAAAVVALAPVQLAGRRIERDLHDGAQQRLVAMTMELARAQARFAAEDPAAVDVDLPARPAPAIEAIAYFVVAEALTNVAKHARATWARVDVRAATGDAETFLRAVDAEQPDAVVVDVRLPPTDTDHQRVLAILAYLGA
ncbi:MAG: histidine kinase, partial [Streptosporangiaceae bacterium]